MDKARAMRLACNAPPDMWDEFCATAAYLTNFTGTMANNGKTPYELWHGKIPSLYYLCEIGCRAYALIATHNPKINHRSIPCILIGYAPNSKAYRLWDPTTNHIFDSFHILFIEHHQSATLSPSTPTSAAHPNLTSSPPSLPSLPSTITKSSHPPPPTFPSPPSTVTNSTLPQNVSSTPFTTPIPPLTSSNPPSSTTTPQFSMSPSPTVLFPTITPSASTLASSCLQNNVPNNISDNSPTLASILPAASSSLTLHHDSLPAPDSLNPRTTLPSQQNNVIQNNTVLQQDTIPPQDSNTQQDTSIPQDNVTLQDTPTIPSPSTRIIINPPPSSPNPCPSPPSCIPVSTCPLPCHSPRLAAL